jgi:hypothetical protein
MKKLTVGDLFIDNIGSICKVVTHRVPCNCDIHEVCLVSLVAGIWKNYDRIGINGECTLGRDYDFKRWITSIEQVFYAYKYPN